MGTVGHASAEVLELPTSAARQQDYRANRHSLSPAPIPGDWILAGKPLARCRRLAGSTDGLGATLMWDCTAGRFHWYYSADETVYLVEGSITVVDSAGQLTHLKAGDTFLFPKGTRFEWTVHNYVRKVAFVHQPVSRKVRLLMRMSGLVRGLLRGKAR